MEEILSLFGQLLNAKSDEEIHAVEENLSQYGMSQEFVNIVFQIILNSNELNIQKQASYYICVAFDHNFDQIPDDTKTFIAENFPQLLFSIDFSMYDYYEKFAKVLIKKIYIYQLNDALQSFIAFFDDPSRHRAASLFFNQLADVSTSFKTNDIMSSFSYLIMQNAMPIFNGIIENTPDLYVKKNLFNAIQSLIFAISPTTDQATPEYLEVFSSFMTNAYHLIEISIPILENSNQEFFVPFFVSFITLFCILVRIDKNYFEANEEFVSQVALFIHEHVLALKNDDITFAFFRLLSISSPIISSTFDPLLQVIIESIILPLYILTPESISLAENDPIEFSRNCIYQAAADSDIKSMSALLLSIMVNEFPSFKELIIQYFQHALEQFSQDQDAATLFSFLHMISKTWYSLMKGHLTNEEETSIPQQGLELMQTAAELLESDDLFLRSSILLILAQMPGPNDTDIILPIPITFATVEQIGTESPLLQYLGCDALIPQLELILKNQEALNEFSEGFDVLIPELIEAVMSISSDSGDPDLAKLITLLANVPAFQEQFVSIAPDLVDQSFEFAVSFLNEEETEVDSGSFTFFNEIMNIIDRVKNKPELLTPITERCTQHIMSNLELFDTPLVTSLIELLNCIISNDPSSHQHLCEISIQLLQNLPDTVLSNMDTCDSVCMIIHNILVSMREQISENVQLIMDIVTQAQTRIKSAASINYIISAALICLPESAEEERSTVFSMAIEIINGIDFYEAFDLEDNENLIHTLFVYFPQQTLESLESPMDIITSFIDFMPSFPITIVEICVAVYPFLDPEVRDEIMPRVLGDIRPSTLFKRISISDYDIDNFIVRQRPVSPLTDQQRLNNVVTFFRGINQENHEIAQRQLIERFLIMIDHPEQEEVFFQSKRNEINEEIDEFIPEEE